MTVEQGVFGVAEAPAEAPAPPHRWTDVSPHPWRRYFARMVDVTVVGTPCLFLFAVLAWIVAPDSLGPALSGRWMEILSIILVWPILAPVNALLIGRTGGTFGKWIYGIKVLGADGRPLGFRRAFARELDVWTRGLGLALPLVSLIMALNAYGKLTEEGQTLWDKRQGNVVLHRPWSWMQQVLGAGVLVALITLSVLGRLA